MAFPVAPQQEPLRTRSDRCADDRRDKPQYVNDEGRSRIGQEGAEAPGNEGPQHTPDHGDDDP